MIFIGVIGLIWISYISFDLLKNESTGDFKSYFNENDRQVIAIHEFSEVDRNSDNFILPPSNEALLFFLSSKVPSASYYVSSSRPIIVVERRENWTKSAVRNLFRNGIFPLKMGRMRSFTFGKFQGEYSKKQLILYACDLKITKSYIFDVDTKASFSKIQFNTTGIEITDVYNKANSTIQYKKTIIGTNNVRRHDDRKLFASILPDKFSSYSFYDKYYLSKTEPEFNKSPIRKWVESGLVILRNNGSSIALFDFKEGQSPIQNLNEIYGKEELNEEFASFDDVKFTSLIRQESKRTLYFAESDGFCLVSYDKGLLDEVLTEIKLGHSLSQNESKTEEIYGELPRKVSCRIIDSMSTKAISIFGKNSIEITYSIKDVPLEKEVKKVREYFSMNPGERVLDFACFNERGNTIILTESKKIVGYINGLKKWEKQLKGEISLKTLSTDNSLISVFVNGECQLFDKYGKNVLRYNSIKNICPEQFVNQSKKEFLVANSNNTFVLLGENGSVVKQFSCVGNIKEMAATKINNRYVGLVATKSMLYSIDLNKRKTLQKITIDSSFVLGKDEMSLYAVSLNKGELTVINHKGQKNVYSVGNYERICSVFQDKDGLSIALKRGNKLGVFDATGKRKWESTFELSELTEFYSYLSKNNRVLSLIFDGIENELHLLDSKGNLIANSSKHAEQRIEISSFGNSGFSITTFLSNYIIQYNKQ